MGAKARQLRVHLVARVHPEERVALAAWLRPAELALFDGMHVADQRHGLDVMAFLRRTGVRDRDVLVAGLLHDCAKGDTGAGPRIAWSLGEGFGGWVVDVARWVPGWSGPLDRLRDHAEASAAMLETAGLSSLAVDLVRSPGSPARHAVWGPLPRRGRGELMTIAASPSIAFGDGRRPEAATRVTLPAFDGPLALLLTLIEARQLDVLTVPLGALAEAYLDALATLDEDRMGNVSAFVAIASQLILIKSRALLPRHTDDGAVALPDDGPDPEAELRARLILYRAFRDAGALLLDEAQRRVGLFHREAGTARVAGLAGARPAETEPLSVALLTDALDGLARIVPPPPPPPETIRRTVTLTSRAAIIRDALRGAPAIVLQELLHGVRDRVVVAVTFLAMLELMKRREIVVEQAEPWGPIVARRTTAEERAAAGLPTVDEEAPLDESLGSFA